MDFKQEHLVVIVKISNLLLLISYIVSPYRTIHILIYLYIDNFEVLQFLLLIFFVSHFLVFSFIP